MKRFYFFLVVFISFSGCTSSEYGEVPLKDALIKKMLETEELDFAKTTDGKLVIFVNDYCEKLPCERYFDTFSEEFIFYKREDLFMRGLIKYVEITEINEKEGVFKIKKVDKRVVRDVIIRL